MQHYHDAPTSPPAPAATNTGKGPSAAVDRSVCGQARRRARIAGGLLIAAGIAGYALGAEVGSVAQDVDDAARHVETTEYVEALNVVEAAIETIERESNRYDPALVRPLVVLGDALAGVGDNEGAFGAYDRALHIARVNHGLHHPSQVQIVYREARLLAKLGDRQGANRRHEYAYGVLLRGFGANDPRLLPGVFVLADYYMATYNIFSARDLYEHAADIAGASNQAPARVKALRGVAATFRRERFPPAFARRRDSNSNLGSYTGFQYRPARNASVNNFAKGGRALTEVVNILRKDGSDDETLAKAMLELGDWYIMFEKYSQAISLYRTVWELLESKPGLRETTFAAPVALYIALPSPPGAPDSGAPRRDKPSQGVVELSIDVDQRGQVHHIVTLRSEPKDLMDFKVRRAVRQARYRPAFDGEHPQPTEDVRVEHRFLYYPSYEGDA